MTYLDEKKMEQTVSADSENVKNDRETKKIGQKKMTAAQQTLTYVHDLVYTMAIVMVVFLLFFRVVVVEGPSMNDTLMSKDYLFLLSRAFYREPQQGDIVVASMDHFNAGEPIVKRVIAREGQTVDINFDTGIVSVDGVELSEPYTRTLTTQFEGTEFPLTVSEGHVFLLGDNRAQSMDSRDPRIGEVDTREIMGKVLFILFPGNNEYSGGYGSEVPRDFGRIGVVS